MNLTVQQLAYLVAVADHDTFSEAAASLGVTTSALSQGVAELERRIGLDLFERMGRRQVLRDDASEVLDHARRVVADTRDLGRWIASVTAGRTGQLRVGMIDAAAVQHFPEPIRAFRRDVPDVELRLVVAPSGALLEQLARGDLDVAVVVQPDGPNNGLELDGLVDERIVVVPPEGTDVGAPATWGPWVLFPAGSHTRALIERELRALGATVDVVAESHQPEVLREMARLGMGWTALPVATAQGGVDLGKRQLVVARRRGRTANAAAELFVAYLQGNHENVSGFAPNDG